MKVSLGATIISRGIADVLVEHLARFGIASEVVKDGRYWRVIVYPMEQVVDHRGRKA